MENNYYEAGFLTHDIKMVTGVNVKYESKGKFIIIDSKKESLTFLLDFLFTKWGFNYLLMMNCGIENNNYIINYILSSRKPNIPIIIKISIPKEIPVFTTMGMIYKIAYQYEEKIYEKHSIVFEGNPRTLSYFVKNTFGKSKEND
ncbi:MAG: hypothetical protein COX48_00075 [bacterium (Candidatus Stahlbacteria) CG23_combo_of_CG06-09_8_20_14_all_34_7]|nr:MAG: hypothetical protein COX48_00075 [bacterium (Candidatus Stahlbacteria) CG23_combo_of_CG06-09_8_20_14_all_34_7]